MTQRTAAYSTVTAMLAVFFDKGIVLSVTSMLSCYDAAVGAFASFTMPVRFSISKMPPSFPLAMLQVKRVPLSASVALQVIRLRSLGDERGPSSSSLKTCRHSR